MVVQPVPDTQLFSQRVVELHAIVHPRVQFVMAQPCELLQVMVQLPPGQSSVQSAPLMLLHVNVHPPCGHDWVQPALLLQLSVQLPPVHV